MKRMIWVVLKEDFSGREKKCFTRFTRLILAKNRFLISRQKKIKYKQITFEIGVGGWHVSGPAPNFLCGHKSV